MKNNRAAKKRELMNLHTRRHLRILGELWEQSQSFVHLAVSDNYVLVHLNNHKQGAGSFV
jgi:hypothetical protein